MKLSIRIKFILFLLLVILNISMRFPTTPHEIGHDSFAIHALSNSISEFGYAKWWINPTSIFGFYPYSYASLIPFLLSGISQTTGIDMEWVIWLFCVIFGVFSIFAAYIMAGIFENDDVFKFLVAFGFSLSPGILNYTTWTITTRGLFIIMLPLFIYLLLKTRTFINKFGILVLIFLIVLTAIHHLVYFTIPVIISYFIIIFLEKIKNYLTFIKININRNFINIGLIATFIIAFMIPYTTGIFIKGSRNSYVFDILLDYLRYNGILIIFAFSGLLYLMLKQGKKFQEWFLLLSLLVLTPLLYQPVYMKWFIIPFVFLLIGTGLTNVSKKYEQKRKYVGYVIIVSLLLSISVSGYYQFIHFTDTPRASERYMDDAIYTASLWIKEMVDRPLISTSTSTSFKTLAISEVPTLVGDTSDLVYGFVNKDNISVIKLSPTSMRFYSDNPYLSNATPTVWFVEALEGETVDNYWGQRIITRFNISYLIENNFYSNNRFIMSAHENKNNLYNNGKILIWDLN